MSDGIHRHTESVAAYFAKFDAKLEALDTDSQVELLKAEIERWHERYATYRNDHELENKTWFYIEVVFQLEERLNSLLEPDLEREVMAGLSVVWRTPQQIQFHVQRADYQVRKMLRRLVNRGTVEREAEDGRSYRYRLARRRDQWLAGQAS